MEAEMQEIKGIARVKFHPGKVEEWKRLTEQAMEIVRTETEAVVFERYRDADAAIEHFANIGHLMEPIMATRLRHRRGDRNAQRQDEADARR
jgi:quinol monooxygenase YgiN